MKFLAAALGALAAAEAVAAQYNWGVFVYGNHSSTAPVRSQKNSAALTKVDANLRCGQDWKPAKTTVTVHGGDKVGFQLTPRSAKVSHGCTADNIIRDLGPVSIYMGIVPAGKRAYNWDGSGVQWVKLTEWSAEYDPFTFQSYHLSEIATIAPPPSPDGEYLIRLEQISLEIPDKPKFWVSCAQINLVNGGDSKPQMYPTPLYSATDPGLTVDIFNPTPTNYTVPGPVALVPLSSL